MLKPISDPAIAAHDERPGLRHEAPFVDGGNQLAGRIRRVDPVRIPVHLNVNEAGLALIPLGQDRKVRYLRPARRRDAKAGVAKAITAGFPARTACATDSLYSAGSGSGLLLMVRRSVTVVTVGVSDSGATSPMNGARCVGATDTTEPIVSDSAASEGDWA